MSSQAYVGSADRTFRQGLVHLLESEYKLLGSRRILDLLAQDVQALVDQFYPAPGHVSSGWMVFTGTRATPGKAFPGRQACDYELVTLAWPVLLPEDLDYLASHSETKAEREHFFINRLVRIIEYGNDHPEGPVLLTVADLAAMLGLTTIQISLLLKQAREQTNKPLFTKGYHFDQGLRPSHKDEIIDRYENGVDEADIARQTNHDQNSVGRYIRDYERVKVLLQKQSSVEEIPAMSGLRPSVVQAYANLFACYHPDSVACVELVEQVSTNH